MTLGTNPPLMRCPKCQENMRFSLVRTCIWQDDRLFVIDDVPAQFCDSCMEQYYSDKTAEAIKQLADEGFPAAKVTREILVAVFSLGGRVSSTSGAGD
jgi:YgiT-type zinc finger domain-containing protein